MLQITGKCLDITSEPVNGGAANGGFDSVTIHLLCGVGAQTSVNKVRVGRDFPGDQLPKRDELVTLNIFASVYSGRNGAGLNFTAMSRAKAPAHV